MIIGVPKEIKNNEFRVSATPSGVHALVRAGHSVLVETSAGLGSAITDADYVAAGATIISTSDEVWAKADLILKVKEPIAPEYPKMRKGQILFTYLHLAASRECTDALIKSGTTAIAFETVEVNGQLPLLAPMSEVAGRMSIQVGATALQKPEGGRGVLLGGAAAGLRLALRCALRQQCEGLGGGDVLPPHALGGAQAVVGQVVVR